jgi:hypothetical protein
MAQGDDKLKIDSNGQSVTATPIWWDRFVDVATVVWLSIFITGLIKPTVIPSSLPWIPLSVFVADLVVKISTGLPLLYIKKPQRELGPPEADSGVKKFSAYGVYIQGTG